MKKFILTAALLASSLFGGCCYTVCWTESWGGLGPYEFCREVVIDGVCPVGPGGQ